MKRTVYLTLALLGTLGTTPLAAAQHTEKAAEKKAAPAMDEKKAMEIMQAYATPGEGHRLLQEMTGTWDASVKMWMDPKAPAMESTGTAENKMILGGRYLEQRFQGKFMDQPFEGVGHTAYDNTAKKYFSTWIDSMGTGMMVTEGTADAGGKSLATRGRMMDPMAGKMVSIKEVVRMPNADTINFELWGPAPDGKVFRMMEITYKRKK